MHRASQPSDPSADDHNPLPDSVGGVFPVMHNVGALDCALTAI
jgi:hypothetical protein